MSILKEFKAFALKGSMIDMAIGVIIGAATTTVVQSLVNDIIMPPIGVLLGNIDFGEMYYNLSDGEFESLAAAQEAGAATINYGLFINHSITFAIVAWIVFLFMKTVNTWHKKEAKKPSKDIVLLTEIRDALQKNKKK